MKCANCNIEIIESKNRQPDLIFDINEQIHYTDPIYYICPQCGLIQIYANQEFLKHIKDK